MKKLRELCVGDMVYTINRNYNPVEEFPLKRRFISDFLGRNFRFTDGKIWGIHSGCFDKEFSDDIATSYDKAFEMAAMYVGCYNKKFNRSKEVKNDQEMF